MKRRRFFLVTVCLAAALTAGVMTFRATRSVQPAQRAPSPLDALSAEEAALYHLADETVVSPVEDWLAPFQQAAPGEKVDGKKRLLAEMESRASAAKIPADGLAARLTAMAGKLRRQPSTPADMAAIAAFAAMDFESLHEPAAGTPGAWRTWLAIGKSHFTEWQIPEALKAYESALAAWPAEADPRWKRRAVIVLARLLAYQDRSADGEALLRKHGPQPGAAPWPDMDAGWWANELGTRIGDQGKLIEAEPEFRLALELTEKHFGLIHANVAINCGNLAFLLLRRGILNDAVDLLERAEAVGAKTLPPGDIRRMHWALTRAMALTKLNKPAEATELLDATLIRAQKHLGSDHFMVSRLRQAMAECARTAGARTTADQVEGEALDDMEALTKEKDPARAGVLNMRARSALTRGDYAGAERLYRHVLELTEKNSLGPDRGNAAADLGEILLMQRRTADAKRLLEPAVTRIETEHGEAASELIRLVRLLAILRNQEGKPALARILFQRALSISEKNTGPESIETTAALNDLAGFNLAEGKRGEAEKLYRRILSAVGKLSGPQSKDSITATFALARCIRDQGRAADAIPLIEKAIGMMDAALPPNDPFLIQYLTIAARTYQTLDRHADAKPLARRALAVALTVRGPEHEDTVVAISTLAASLFAHGEDEEAEQLLQSALAILTKARRFTHPDLATCLTELSDIRIKKGAYADAESLLRAALAIAEATVPANNPGLAMPLSNLAILLHARNRSAEAEPLTRRALTIVNSTLAPGAPLPDYCVKLRKLYEMILAAQGVRPAEIESRLRATMPRAN